MALSRYSYRPYCINVLFCCRRHLVTSVDWKFSIKDIQYPDLVHLFIFTVLFIPFHAIKCFLCGDKSKVMVCY